MAIRGFRVEDRRGSDRPKLTWTYVDTCRYDHVWDRWVLSSEMKILEGGDSSTQPCYRWYKGMS